MENRKELSEKSKKLIAKQFKSDILNTSTGYYKKEKIFPITPKPNESREKYEEFIPKYKEIKPYEMHFNNLLSDQQRHNRLLMNNLKIIQIRRNPEIEIKRKRDKIIKDNCYDKRGNFSAKKRYCLEFYGLENINKNIYKRSNSKSIKEKRKENKSFISYRIPKSLSINNDNTTIYSYTDNYSTIINKENYNSDIENINDNNNNNDNNNDNKDNDNDNENNTISYDFFNNNIRTKKLHNKTTRNKDYNIYHDLGNSFNYKINKSKDYHRIKTDINYTNRYIPKTIDNSEKEKGKNKVKQIEKKYYHPKGLEKVFYTQKDKPVKSNRNNKKEKLDENSDYYDIQIKNLNSLKHIPDKKRIKEIFYKNGLHVYDFNEDGMNILSRDKKMEAKIRKNKKDEDFDRNYRKASKELKKLNITIDKRKMLTDKGFESKVVRKKRKGTPGRVLYKNQQNKDENTRLNTGFGFKRDKNIMPQKNQNYKNYYSYRLSYFNHNKK